MINICRSGADLLDTIAEECFHMYQDLSHGAGCRAEAGYDAETGGVGITLTKFTINQSDLTSMIQLFFGSLHVGPNGALKANLVSSGSGDLTFTVKRHR